MSNQADSVTGGDANTASGNYSSISGGYQSTASGLWSAVAAGQQNPAAGELGSVLGGKNNTVESGALYSAILGGSIDQLTGNCQTLPHYRTAADRGTLPGEQDGRGGLGFRHGCPAPGPRRGGTARRR